MSDSHLTRSTSETPVYCLQLLFPVSVSANSITIHPATTAQELPSIPFYVIIANSSSSTFRIYLAFKYFPPPSSLPHEYRLQWLSPRLPRWLNWSLHSRMGSLLWPTLCSRWSLAQSSQGYPLTPRMKTKVLTTVYEIRCHLASSVSLTSFMAESERTWKWSRSVVSDSLRPMDCSPPGSSVHGIFQAWILEWVAISFFRGSSRPRDWTWVSCIIGRRFTTWATRETLMHLWLLSP